MTWGYNADSNPTSISYATNGTAGLVQSYGYDNNGNLTSQTTGGNLPNASYTYTPSGQITSAGQPGGTAYSTMTDQHGDVTAAFSPR